MVEGDFGCCLIVVGDLHDRLVAEVLRVGAEYEVPVARCDDIYAAVVDVAGGTGRGALVVGQLRELARENGHFFTLAARHGVRCCVLSERPGGAERREFLMAVRAGASVIDRIDDIRSTVGTWLTDGRCPSRATRVRHEEWRATEAELDALLGREADG